jgi:DNA-binding beta-propeller fold protein YncE
MSIRSNGSRRRLAAVLSLVFLLLGVVLFTGGGRVESAREADSAGLPPAATRASAECDADLGEFEQEEGRGRGQGSGRARSQEAGSTSAGDAEGDITPYRCLWDPYPTFNGVAVDPQNNVVAMSDTNRKSLLVYDRGARGRLKEETTPLRQIAGPRTQVGFIAGVALDAERRELYAVNNDIEDTMMVFSYDAEGNAKPKRALAVPHQAWGVALRRSADEIALTIESLDAVVFYRREADYVEAPLRSLIGPDTGMADPHGLYIDDSNHELVVVNHGNWGDADVSSGTFSETVGGHFQPPSINVYADSASGNTKPLRTVSGPSTGLNWPMGVALDPSHGEIVVANNGDNSILFFNRTATGDARPSRLLRGGRTGIASPMGVAVDAKNRELWVANFGDHTALVFDLYASGNAAPKRVVRNAPAGTPTAGFGNPMAVAYDSKRQELLVPN